MATTPPPSTNTNNNTSDNDDSNDNDDDIFLVQAIERHKQPILNPSKGMLKKGFPSSNVTLTNVFLNHFCTVVSVNKELRSADYMALLDGYSCQQMSASPTYGKALSIVEKTSSLTKIVHIDAKKLSYSFRVLARTLHHANFGNPFAIRLASHFDYILSGEEEEDVKRVFINRIFPQTIPNNEIPKPGAKNIIEGDLWKSKDGRLVLALQLKRAKGAQKYRAAAATAAAATASTTTNSKYVTPGGAMSRHQQRNKTKSFKTTGYNSSASDSSESSVSFESSASLSSLSSSDSEDDNGTSPNKNNKTPPMSIKTTTTAPFTSTPATSHQQSTHRRLLPVKKTVFELRLLLPNNSLVQSIRVPSTSEYTVDSTIEEFDSDNGEEGQLSHDIFPKRRSSTTGKDLVEGKQIALLGLAVTGEISWSIACRLLVDEFVPSNYVMECVGKIVKELRQQQQIREEQLLLKQTSNNNNTSNSNSLLLRGGGDGGGDKLLDVDFGNGDESSMFACISTKPVLSDRCLLEIASYVGNGLLARKLIAQWGNDDLGIPKIFNLQDLKSKRCRVWWGGDQIYYEGYVESVIRTKKGIVAFRIHYDDGMRKTEWAVEILKPTGKWEVFVDPEEHFKQQEEDDDNQEEEEMDQINNDSHISRNVENNNSENITPSSSSSLLSNGIEGDHSISLLAPAIENIDDDDNNNTSRNTGSSTSSSSSSNTTQYEDCVDLTQDNTSFESATSSSRKSTYSNSRLLDLTNDQSLLSTGSAKKQRTIDISDFKSGNNQSNVIDLTLDEEDDS
jgi:hypothetical protein